ncbi:MAG: ATP-binding protein [Chloroflexi bacterium]|nr:ATP-binding protein [Chloroflexota bacterium]
MTKLFYSLQLKLVLAFVAALGLSLAGVSWYIGYAADREVARFTTEFEEARAAQTAFFVGQNFSGDARPGIQLAVEQASALYGRHFVVTDAQGNIIANSDDRKPPRLDDGHRDDRRNDRRPREVAIVRNGEQVGLLSVTATAVDTEFPEPPPTQIAASITRSMLWAGLVTGGVGIILVSLFTRGMLSPVNSLTTAARRLGQGDFSLRTRVTSQDEVGELARTFDSMAAGLEHAEQQRKSLMADVAHELRTPLANILGYIEGIKDGVLQPDEKTIDTIHQQAIHLNKLVEDVRLVALTDAGALRLSKYEVSVAELVQDAVHDFQRRGDAKGITVTANVEDGLPRLELDRTRMAQVLHNLLDNAVAHTHEGGSVTVAASRIGNAVRIAVADTGEGIAPEDLPRVFERFHRGDPSRARSTGGSGLGPTIVKNLVEAHNGAVSAQSEVGKGSTFTVDLPV